MTIPFDTWLNGRDYMICYPNEDLGENLWLASNSRINEDRYYFYENIKPELYDICEQQGSSCLFYYLKSYCGVLVLERAKLYDDKNPRTSIVVKMISETQNKPSFVGWVLDNSWKKFLY